MINMTDRIEWRMTLCIVLVLSMTYSESAADEKAAIGISGQVGCDKNAEKVQRLRIEKSGVYENLLVDGEWIASTLVKIKADDVTLRHCEIRNGLQNGIFVSGKNVTIDSCKIHHLLAGSFKKQKDAHGITGQPNKLLIRNCEIFYVSGDSLQFDPGRSPWDDVTIENCTLWTGPLPGDAAGFKRGEVPGENAVDTKQLAKNPRSRMTIRRSVMHGWRNGPISNMAALNLKNHVQVTVSECLLYDNEICFRLRGGSGKRGGALVSIERCAVDDCDVALRIEDKIEGLSINGFGLGKGVARRNVMAGGGAGRGFKCRNEFAAPPLERLRIGGFKKAARRK